MQKFAKFIVKNYKYIILVFAILTILSCIAMPTVIRRLNSEIMSYLPTETATSQGLVFLEKNFGIKADAMVGAQGITPTEAQAIARKIDLLYYNESTKKVYIHTGYVTCQNPECGEVTPIIDENFNHYDHCQNCGEPISVADKKVVNQCLYRYADFIETYRVGGAFLGATEKEINEVIDIFYDDNDTEDNYYDDAYVYLLMIDFSPSSQQAFDAIELIENTINEYGKYYGQGTTVLAKDIFESTLGEVIPYTCAGMAVVILVLFLFTKSWIDPIIMIITLAVSILLNIGSNIIFKTNSIITFACSALLQMALAMDYAVFLIHAYRDELKSTLDPFEALEKAIPRTFKSVFASAMTTVGGFAALFFMRFGIGADMGGVLAKGIFMSFITVVFLQPAFMIILRKPMSKWQHRAIEWKFRKPVKGVIKFRSVIVALFIIAIFPAVLYQSGIEYNYFGFINYEKDDSAMYPLVDNASHQLIIAVPFNIDDPDSVNKQYEYLGELRAMEEANGDDSVSFILGLASLIPEDKLTDPSVKNMLQSQEAYAQFANNGFTLYTVGLNNQDIESDAVFAMVKKIEAITAKHFEGESVYVTGMSQAARDFAAITPLDFNRVSIASVLIIIFVLLITFRSIKHSALLILLIEFGIWLNLCLQRIIGTEINFMSYIIISSIQLGATVDYAILITSKYREFRKRMLPAHAAYQATTSSVMSVLTSSCIIAGACTCVRLMSSVLIVAEMTSLIARGALFSAALTLFVLPALLAFTDRPNKSKVMQILQQDKLRKFKFKKAQNAWKYYPDPSKHTAPAEQPELVSAENLPADKLAEPEAAEQHFETKNEAIERIQSEVADISVESLATPVTVTNYGENSDIKIGPKTVETVEFSAQVEQSFQREDVEDEAVADDAVEELTSDEVEVVDEPQVITTVSDDNAAEETNDDTDEETGEETEEEDVGEDYIEVDEGETEEAMLGEDEVETEEVNTEELSDDTIIDTQETAETQETESDAPEETEEVIDETEEVVEETSDDDEIIEESIVEYPKDITDN